MSLLPGRFVFLVPPTEYESMRNGPARIATVFTQAQFDEYARLSGDDNPIHVDRAFAAGTRFERTVAHGMFLFANLQAAVARATGRAVSLRAQEFMFRAPTFTGDALVIELQSGLDDTVAEEITDSAATVTVSGTAFLGEPDGSTPPPPTLIPSDPYRGLEVGMCASRTRSFQPGDVADYLLLVNDPNPRFVGDAPELPPGLLAGVDSWVLGVDLPGPGTNWLKQRFAFHHPVRVPVEVTSTVTITRIRPEKGLINLATRCTTSAGIVTSGEALVLAVDVATR